MIVGDCVIMLDETKESKIDYVGLVLGVEKVFGIKSVTGLWSDGLIMACSESVLERLWPQIIKDENFKL